MSDSLHGTFQVLELLREGGGEAFDTMCLLRALGQVKTDVSDGTKLHIGKDGSDVAGPGEENSSTELKGKYKRNLDEPSTTWLPCCELLLIRDVVSCWIILSSLADASTLLLDDDDVKKSKDRGCSDKKEGQQRVL